MRCILFLSPPRTGSSAVAGALSQIGVQMGLRLQGPNEWAPFGAFECTIFAEAVDSLINERWITKVCPAKCLSFDWRSVLDCRNIFDIWGLKYAKSMLLLPYFLPFLPDDLKVVSTHRRIEGAIQSLAKHFPSIGEAAEVQGYYFALQRSYERIFSDVCRIDFEALKADKETEIMRLVGFVFAGLDKPDISPAVGFIQ